MKLLLCCSGGMSTAFLISAMEKEAKKLNIPDFSVKAVGTNEIADALDSSYDLLLLAPQVRFMYDTYVKLCAEKKVKIYKIETTEYSAVGVPTLMKSIKKVLG